MLILIPWWIICHFSLSLKYPTLNFILQAGLLHSPEKSFFLPIYAEAMARASPPRQPTFAPCPRHGIDLRVLNYINISAIIDTSFRIDRLDSRCSSLFGEIFECCSDNSMPTSS